MARLRFIHPDIWTDPAVGSLSPTERLMFIGLFSIADDEGRLPGTPAYLRSNIFPYDDFTNEQVRIMRDNIAAACPNVLIYTDGKVEYIALIKWLKYQNPRYAKPSKYPAPNCGDFAANSQQACNHLATSLQPNSNCLASMDSDSDSDSDSDLDSDSDSTSTPTPSSEVPYNEIVKAYNDSCTLMPKVARITGARRRAMKARWKDYGKGELQPFTDLFRRASQSAFLNGENDRGWYADFEWLLNESNLTKVLEGKYDRATRASPKQTNETNIQRNDKFIDEVLGHYAWKESNNADKQEADCRIIEANKHNLSK